MTTKFTIQDVAYFNLIGAAHGDISGLHDVCYDIDDSYDEETNMVQLGDLGFDYSRVKDITDDFPNFKFIGGNHDNYKDYHSHHASLGDFGLVPDSYDQIFFVRGGLSIDKKYRTLGVDYFAEEELDYNEMIKCFEAYLDAKPPVLIAHECPMSLIKNVSPIPDEVIFQRFGCRVPSHTSVLLDEMIKAHKPQLIVHGHHHVSKCYDVNGIRVYSLAPLEYICIGDLV